MPITEILNDYSINNLIFNKLKSPLGDLGVNNLEP